ncbi:MAG: hypothetical protein EBW68_09115 [Actinobacteria bacterium]|nr:hypothetical protein [Actinomycetota bacterium]
MTVSSVTAQNLKFYQQSEVRKIDRRHEELRIEERRISQNIKITEEARIEMNRRLNRPGQNVDSMA